MELNDVCTLLEDEIITELCIECYTTPLSPLNNGHNEAPSRPSTSRAKESDWSLLTCRCPVCRELVGTRRFTTHLERCMKGNSRRMGKTTFIIEENNTSKGPFYPFPSSSSRITSSSACQRNGGMEDKDMFASHNSYKRRNPNIIRILLKDGGI